ncbi:EcKinase, APH, and/or DUF1679 domain containing protein [Asbolus verrucosus]|uniref:EcKinase, APH, and/or DUF1679 domain containing protein n=1 Tax=Asbolus verrucosus TaxID=1661398 RepID=A0A482W7G9_ASBVE|nr:EcKinase, APH, and/or DUF1679 domain containing protein [Asbolus verrucosus]
MNLDKIEKIEDLLIFDKNKKIIEHKIKRLTAPGENYGSLMLSVDIMLKNSQGTEEINVVAKMVPPNEFIQEIFNTPVTFRNEIGFYKNIVPVLQNFQREHGVDKVIDFFSKYYGSRLNLKNNNDKVDADAALLLENLKVQNFVNLERTEGFDLDVAKLVLTDLAYLHAVPLALKLQKPEVFEKKIQPYLSPWSVKEKMYENIKKYLYPITDNLQELKPFLERLHKSLEKLVLVQPPREPFATIIHNDCWVNNTMIKLEDGKPIKNKLVDFQICDYGSPAKDIVFFLFTSVKTEVIKQHYDGLIQFYYKVFTSILLELKCDIAQFSFEAFEKELDYEAKHSQFGHILFMLYPIFAPKGSVKEINELNPNSMSMEPTPSYIEKLIFVVKEFAKRNWI